MTLEITKGVNQLSEDKPMLKYIYKKSLAMDLIRKGHDLSYTVRNRDRPKWYIYVFEDTPELRKDMAEITGHEYVPED